MSSAADANRLPDPTPIPTTNPDAVAEQAAALEPDPTRLTPYEARVLDFERTWAGRAGAKDAAIRAQFSLSPARYYQVLHGVIDRPIALASDPLLVRRLQRIRDARALARSSRGFRSETSDQDTTD